jgi:hypothetical protein
VARATAYSYSGQQYYLYGQHNAYYGTVVARYAEYDDSTTVRYFRPCALVMKLGKSC